MPRVLLNPVEYAPYLRNPREFHATITDCARVPMNDFARGVGSVSRGAVATAFFNHKLDDLCREYLEHTASKNLSPEAMTELRLQAGAAAHGMERPVLAVDYLRPTVHSSYVALPRWESWRSFVRNLASVSLHQERVVFSYTLDVSGRLCEYRR